MLIKSILAFAILLGFIWSLFLFTNRRGNRKANAFLAILVISLDLLLLRQLRIHTEYISVFQLFYFLSQSIILIIGPSIYFFISASLYQNQNPENYWKHYGYAIAMLFLMIIAFIYKTYLLKSINLSGLRYLIIGIIAFQLTHLLYYLHKSKKLISDFEQKSNHPTTFQNRINLNWAKNIFRISCFFTALIIGMYLLIISGGYYEMNNSADFLFLLLLSLIIVSIILKSWQKPEAISGIYAPVEKYSTDKLNDQMLIDYGIKLDKFMKDEKIYLNSDLKLNQLADKMNISPHRLSQLINVKIGKSYQHYINAHRVKHFINLVETGQLSSKTITGLAFESGFNSKSAFQRAFKKEMNCTPKEFHQRILKET